MPTWDDLCEATRTQFDAVRTATPATLDAFEATSGFRFPARYREFAQTFGTGAFVIHRGDQGRFGTDRFISIYIPVGPSSRGNDPYDLDQLNEGQAMPGAQAMGASSGAADRKERLIFFATDHSLNSMPESNEPQCRYGWDPTEVTDTATGDCAIYRVCPPVADDDFDDEEELDSADDQPDPSADGESPVRVAASFEEFLLVHRLGARLAAWAEAGEPRDLDAPPVEPYEGHDEGRGPRIVFEPSMPQVKESRANADLGLQFVRDRYDEDEEEKTVLILGAPREAGGMLMWMEVDDDGSAGMKTWVVTDVADRERLEAFRAACAAIDWSDGEAHEVTIQEPKAAVRTRPTAPPYQPKPVTDPRHPNGLIRRDPNRPVAPVAASWRRLEAWFGQHCPEILAQLLPGATAEEVAEFERGLGCPLPADLRESVMIHDGLRSGVPDGLADLYRASPEANYPAWVGTLFYEYRLDSIAPGRSKNVLGRRAIPRTSDAADPARHAALLRADEVLGDVNDRHTSFPAGAIRCIPGRPRWLPLTNDGGNENNHIGVDLDPGPNGTVGQVINFGRDEDAMVVLAPSWGQFLEDYADELEAGNFAIKDEEQGTEYSLGLRRLKMKSGNGEWGTFGRERWTEAKLAPDALAATAPEVAPPESADSATEAEVHAAFAEFFRECAAWNARWRERFGLDRLGLSMVAQLNNDNFTATAQTPAKFAEANQPVPEGARFVHSRAMGDSVKRQRFFHEQGIVAPAAEAQAEWAAILARHATAGFCHQQRHDAVVWAPRANFAVGTGERFTAQPKPIQSLADGLALVAVAGSRSRDGHYLWRRCDDGAWRLEAYYAYSSLSLLW